MMAKPLMVILNYRTPSIIFSKRPHICEVLLIIQDIYIFITQRLYEISRRLVISNCGSYTKNFSSFLEFHLLEKVSHI